MPWALIPLPTTHSTSMHCFLLLLQHARLNPASGPLHWLFFGAKSSFPRYFHDFLLYFLQVCMQMSPSQGGIAWPHYGERHLTQPSQRCPLSLLHFTMAAFLENSPQFNMLRCLPIVLLFFSLFPLCSHSSRVFVLLPGVSPVPRTVPDTCPAIIC